MSAVEIDTHRHYEAEGYARFMADEKERFIEERGWDGILDPTDRETIHYAIFRGETDYAERLQNDALDRAFRAWCDIF